MAKRLLMPYMLLGNVLLSQDPAVQVPSALEGLTVVFEMGTRGSPPPSSPNRVTGRRCYSFKTRCETKLPLKARSSYYFRPVQSKIALHRIALYLLAQPTEQSLLLG